VGFFYWTLGDLGPAYSGKDWTIFMSMLVWDDSLSNPAYKRDILNLGDASFAAGLNKLNGEHGHLLNTARGPQLVRAQLFVVSADTPAAGYLCSRNISVGSAKCPCRHCKNQIPREQYLGGPGLLGSPEATSAVNSQRNQLLAQHDGDGQRGLYAAANATKQKQLGTSFGLKGELTFFHQVRGFRAVNRVPHDPMHVFLEGILKFEIFLVCHWIAKQLGMGVDNLDNLINTYEHYEDVEKFDKPAKIDACHLEGRVPKTDGKIKQTAGMCIVLARNMGNIFGEQPLQHTNVSVCGAGGQRCLNACCIGGFVHDQGKSNDPKWLSLMLLISIYFACMVDEFDFDYLLMLERMILQWHHLFQRAWGDEYAKPKHHYALHIPFFMWMLGPVKGWWCMRFEAKHQW
jgi:hypothetical protein